jgi:hypothetical protein
VFHPERRHMECRQNASVNDSANDSVNDSGRPLPVVVVNVSMSDVEKGGRMDNLRVLLLWATLIAWISWICWAIRLLKKPRG